MSVTSDLRKEVDKEKKRLYAQYGREKLGREGWLPQINFYLGFVSQGISTDIEGDLMADRLSKVIANLELWVEEEMQ